MVVPYGDSRRERFGSVWMNWWSSVQAANASMRAWSMVIQSLGASCLPTREGSSLMFMGRQPSERVAVRQMP